MRRITFCLGLPTLVIITATVVSRHAASGQETNRSKQAIARSLMSGLGEHHHPISTASAEAQRLFDQGLTLVFAFNHEEAVRSFQRAAELDPQAAMPHWGIALALGPNINQGIGPNRERAAYESIQKALSLAGRARGIERAYIHALAKRYSVSPEVDPNKLAADYAKQMGELMRRYPDDLDAATLYAESLMDLRPWQLWSLNGTPADGTEEIIAVLESVLRRDPNHIGANHYYIHAVEASAHPERALPSAYRLETLAPAAGHLVHMPAHIYLRTGDYLRAAESNAAAVKADEVYFRAVGRRGMYPLMYYSHNLHFLAVAYGEAGRFEDAEKAADQLYAYSKGILMLEGFTLAPTFVLLRFQRWKDILQSRAPEPATPLTNCILHFAWGIAYAATGDVKNAEAERRAFSEVEKSIPAEIAMGDTGLNSARHVLRIGAAMLDAKIESLQGKRDSAIKSWRKAVEAQDALAYDEPPVWYYPVRESLGAALLIDGRPEEAEGVFRADLEKNPRNGRSLFGLWLSLLAQHKTADAESVRRQFETAWIHADIRLSLGEL